jgi:hypothetical protein
VIRRPALPWSFPPLSTAHGPRERTAWPLHVGLRRLVAARADFVLVAGLMLFAGLLRLPALHSVPSLTDETNEALLGLAIARGEALPLTNIATYLSASYNYALAALFLVFGPAPELPRLAVLTIGVSTVGVAYLLARDLARATLGMDALLRARVAGLLAASLLAANGAHVLVNSRIAWSHATTPFFATMALWLLHRALWRGDRRQLVAAAVTLVLTLQSHTTALALLPGVGLAILLSRPRWLSEPWVILGSAVAFAVAISNLVVYNLLTSGDSLFRARAASEAYARGAAPGLDLYLANLGKLGIALARLLGGAVDVRADTAAYLADPLVLLAVALTLVGTVFALARGSSILIVGLPYALLFAYVNSKYQLVPNGRYLTPILPLGFAAIGLAIVLVATRLPRLPKLVGLSTAGAAALLLLLGAYFALQTRLDQLDTSVAASSEIEGAVATLIEHREDQPVALDPDLEKLWLDGGGDYRRAFRYHLILRGIPVSDLETRPSKDQGAIDSCRRNRVELRYVEPATSPGATRLMADDPRTQEDEGLRPYWLFRTVQPRDDERDERRGQDNEWSAIAATYTPPVGASARAVDRCAPGLPI